jgi:hypothetical protein
LRNRTPDRLSAHVAALAVRHTHQSAPALMSRSRAVRCAGERASRGVSARARRAYVRACASAHIFPRHGRRVLLGFMANPFEFRHLTARKCAYIEEQRMRNVAAAFTRLRR